MTTAVIIDDEVLGRARLKRMLGELDVDVLAEGENGLDAIRYVKELQFDLLFLDVAMPRLGGIEAAKRIKHTQQNPPHIIFCTAYDQYAIDAFKVDAIDYILKPFNKESLLSVIEKSQRLSKTLDASLEAKPRFLFAHLEGAKSKILIDQFLCFQSVDKHTYGMLEGGERIFIDHTLVDLQDKFPDYLLRIHRNALVNKSRIESIGKDDSGRQYVIVGGLNECLYVSRRHLKVVKSVFTTD